MKLPRDVTGAHLAKALEVLGYRLVRQRGSHIHLVTDRGGEHHVVVPNHTPIKTGRWASSSSRWPSITE